MNFPVSANHIKNLLKTVDTTNQLTIVNVRDAYEPLVKERDEFNDVSILCQDKTPLIAVRSTTNPGLNYLRNPINNEGTAIVMNGFYKDLWKVGVHKNQYVALVQNKPIIVFRDDNKDDMLDTCDVYCNDPQYSTLNNLNGISFIIVNDNKFKIDRGFFGINFHRASVVREVNTIGLYSAGCCVVQNINDYTMLIEVIKHKISHGVSPFINAYYIEQTLLNTLND